MQKPILIFAFDVEARGKSPSLHGILAVGAVAGLIDGTIIAKRMWNVKPLRATQHYEQRYLDEFWSKNENLKNALENNAVEALIFANEFRLWLNSLEERYTLYLASDNPTFDAGFINYYLDYFMYDSIQYGSDGKSYRLVHDTDSYARGVIHAPFTKQWIMDEEVIKELDITTKTYPTGPAHYPDNDAEKIYWMHCAVVKR